ncbi:hypothetical protein SASPL_139865 [Salvia splendens]|uniref:Protein kinase domain-containing protein n=1 Tax=Salvia splendens TaxID=180675 RepID=A0A8X8WPT8_SALSN|nr:hypothetical protein SASPL_139865 [Salvia splendens]
MSRLWLHTAIHGDLDQQIRVYTNTSHRHKEEFVYLLDSAIHLSSPVLEEGVIVAIVYIEKSYVHENSWISTTIVGPIYEFNIQQSVPDTETDLPANTREPTIASTYLQKATLSRKQQTNSNVVSAHHVPSEKKLARNALMNKPPRPWLWGELWNRVKPSKKSELFSSGKHHSKTNIHIQVSAGKAEIFEADIPLPKFSWATIAASTNRFSSSNIVGRGGSGKVYKAVLPTGKVVAVKRQSPASSQALQDFKSEILLLSNVYSFGIIVLEIVSSRRVWNIAYGEAMKFLPSYAWKLWSDANPLKLVDKLLGGAFPVDEALRCIQEGDEPQVEPKVEVQKPPLPREDVPTGGVHSNEPVVLSTGRTAAVKRYSSSQDQFTWFKNEIHSVSSLHQRSIIKLLDIAFTTKQGRISISNGLINREHNIFFLQCNGTFAHWSRGKSENDSPSPSGRPQSLNICT